MGWQQAHGIGASESCDRLEDHTRRYEWRTYGFDLDHTTYSILYPIRVRSCDYPAKNSRHVVTTNACVTVLARTLLARMKASPQNIPRIPATIAARQFGKARNG